MIYIYIMAAGIRGFKIRYLLPALRPCAVLNANLDTSLSLSTKACDTTAIVLVHLK